MLKVSTVLLQAFLQSVLDTAAGVLTECQIYGGDYISCNIFEMLSVDYWHRLVDIILYPPHRKKSQGVKSGLRAGQGVFSLSPIVRVSNFKDRNCLAALRLWGLAPSCIKNQ